MHAATRGRSWAKADFARIDEALTAKFENDVARTFPRRGDLQMAVVRGAPSAFVGGF